MISPLNKPASLFESYGNAVPIGVVDVWEYLQDESQKDMVEALRLIEDKKERDKLKAKLNCVTISCTIKDTRLIENVTSHSGLMCIDVDPKENPNIKNFESFKAIVSKAKFVAYASLSASGKGYFMIIPIQYPEKHVEHFLALEKMFAKARIIIDKGCKDVTRLRGRSHDSEPYINHNAINFCDLLEIPKPKVRTTNFQYQHLQGDSTQSWVERYIKEVTTRRIDITSSYAEWLKMGFALASEFGENGRDYFHDISAINSDYQVDNCDKQFDRCVKRNGSGVGIGSFFHACKVAEIDLKESNNYVANYDLPQRNIPAVAPSVVVLPRQPEPESEDITEDIPDIIPPLFDLEEYRAWYATAELPTGYILLNGKIPIYNMRSFLEGRMNHVAAFTNYREPGNRSLFIRQLKYVRKYHSHI